MWECLWRPRSRVAAAAAAVGDALAVQSNCTLHVSHCDDGSSLRTIRPQKTAQTFSQSWGHHASAQSNWHHLICIMFPLIIAFSCISIKRLRHLGQDDIRGGFSLLNHGFISRTSLSCHLKWLISGKPSQSGSIRCAVKTKKTSASNNVLLLFGYTLFFKPRQCVDSAQNMTWLLWR